MTYRTSNNIPPISPENYLEQARELFKNPTVENLRSAGDRAYYAAFLFCRDELSKKGYMTPYYSFEDHKYVERRLNEIFGGRDNIEKRVHVFRNYLTYDTRSLNGISIIWMIKAAAELIARIKALPPNKNTNSGLN